MKAASRFPLVLAALVALFVLGMALAVGGLLAWQDPGAGVVLAVATLAGLAAAAIAYAVVRTVDLDAVFEGQPEALEPVRPAPVPARLRVEALPVASLPAPYLEAVMKGLQANRRGVPRERRSPGEQAGC